jgi:hypothetical protein
MINILFLLFFQVPTIELPARISGQPGAFISVPAKTESKFVKWVSIDKGLNIFPVDLLKDSKTLVVTSQIQGVYRLFAYVGNESGPSDPAFTSVVIGDEPAPAPPTPPVNPDGDIKAAASKEDKDQVKWLSMFYDELAKECQKNDYEFLTDVFKAAKATINKQFMENELSNLRDVIGKRLNQRLPKDGTLKLDQKLRDLLTNEFNQIAKELK